MIDLGFSFWKSRPLPLKALIGGGVLNPALVFDRNSPATLVRSTDRVLIEFGSDAPRFDPQSGMLIEGQRTNLHLNSVNGMTGLPVAPNLSAPSTDISAIGASLLVRKHTRDTAATDTNVGTGGSNYAITSGVNTTYSLWIYLPSSQSYGGAPTIRLTPDGHTQVSTLNADFSKRDQWQRINIVFTPTSTGTAGVVIRAASVNNGAFFYSCAPQVETGSFPSQHIITSGTAQTRLADNLSTPLSSLGIGGNGVCTIAGTFTLPQHAIGSAQSLLQIDDGTGNNRYSLRNDVGGSGNINIYRVTGGAGTGGALTGVMSLGTPFRVAVSVDSAGRISASLNGGSAAAHPGGPTSGLTRLRVGVNEGVTESLNGYTDDLGYFPYSVSDAELQQLSTP